MKNFYVAGIVFYKNYNDMDITSNDMVQKKAILES